MPVCSTGSELSPGRPTVIYVDPQYAASLLTPALSWLAPYMPWMPPFTLNMSDFCELEPPANITITTEDLLGLIGGGSFSVALLAGEKIAQLVHILLWYAFCRCIDQAAPTAPTYPTAPTPLPIVNPPGIVALPGGAPCRTDVFHFDGPASSSIQTAVGQTPPAGTTGVQITITGATTDWDTLIDIIYNSAGDHSITGYIERFTQARNYAPDPTVSQVWLRSSDSVHTNVAFKTANLGPYFFVWFHRNGSGGTGAGQGYADLTLEWYCGGATPGNPGTNFTPCASCPPDPYLSAQLQRLFQQLDYLQSQIDLIQRQDVPFAYVPGSLHENLSGAGELDVSGVIGATVTITATMPGTIGSEVGNPEHLFGAGWIQWGSADGYGPRVWLDQVATLSLPDSAGAYTVLAYSLPPGVVVDILELVREP